ncbi:MAG: tRNA (adenosine(37)-N6)-threonylcarbamoyltransferase complex ATPase subunit type 1 TsaE [Candidatus Nealsonbacteria bacterium]
MILKKITNNPSQTKKLGEVLSKKILKEKKGTRAQVLALQGELGGGKTTFLQGFARGLGIKKRILSPTFVILKKFKVQNPDFKFFYHIDCYRIKNVKEILDLGFRKIVSDSKSIVAVEWADNILKTLPKNTIFITFTFNNKNKRNITIRWPNKKSD